MAEVARLDVVLTGNTDQLTVAMGKASGSMINFSKLAEAAENLRPFSGLSANAILASKSVGELTLTLANLKRTQSFTSDPATFKAYGDAIKAVSAEVKNLGSSSGGASGLGKALTGALSSVRQLAYILPGIGIAGIFNLAFEAITAAAGSLNLFGDKTKEVTQDQKDLQKAIDDATSGALATGAKLQSFVNIARDVTKSTEERNYALKEANKLLGEHGEKLTLVNINTKATREEVEKFTQALINEAVAAKYADKAADLTIKQAEASKAYGVALKEYNKQAKEADELNRLSVSGGTGGVGGLGNVNAINKARTAYNTLVDAATNYKDVTGQLNSITGELNTTQEKSVALFTALGTKTKDAAGSTKAAVDKLTPALRRLKFDNDIIIDQPPQQLGSIITKALDKKGGIVVAPKLIVQPNTVDIQALNADLNKALAAIAVNIAEGFGQAIGEAFAGKNPFGNLSHIIGEGIKELGGLLIKYGVLAEIANKAISLGPIGGALAIVAGIGLEALGAYIEAKSIKTHADGGIFTQPTQWGNHIIGEKGPEALVPLNRMNELGLAGGGRQVVVMETRISGSDLILIQNRAQTAAGRAYGSNFNRRN